MALHDHARRRSLHYSRHSGRFSIDDMTRSTNVILHVSIIVMLIALAFGVWYFYGAANFE